ncbi:hypothetical protein GL263_27205 [Streptomyces durbertensis]|uniref:L,D-transpeptidase n=1 Tax=Streptomyces durbertensis TaxID=2448886 RepID=A0ABR6EPD3_9ACTN|nr:hypothetical protein [Streptomyces durbertensis]MBB1247207.1 hypothetical protein [Streptomyces durbertensis]
MARNGAGVFVTGLTAAALAVVAVLAMQAASAKEDAGPAQRPAPAASGSAAPGGEKAEQVADPKALPAGSGEGKRVVYSLESNRVWLVDEEENVTRTFKVTPGTVDPLPGSYTVTSRSANITGSDGVPVENVVRFALNEGVVIGFSAATDGETAEPDPSKKTGGIREARKDGAAMWVFATLDTKVVVLP